MKAQIDQYAKRLLASSKRGRIIQGAAVLSCCLLAIAIRLGGPAPSNVARADEESDSVIPQMAALPAEAVRSVQTAFPPEDSADPSAHFFSDFTSWIADLDLTLETRNVEPTVLDGKPARRIFSRVSGQADRLLLLLEKILHRNPAVAPRSFRWDRGDAPEHRILEMTIDLPNGSRGS